MSKESTVVYEGVADAHGLESFFLVEKKPRVALYYRAMANRQRHAVYFQAVITRTTLEIVNKYLLDLQFKQALVYLKANTTKVSFPEELAESYEKSWRMIPNDDLDPYFIG